MREKRIILIVTLFTIVFTLFGSTLAYWNWQTSESQKTNVVFTLTQDFSCAVDGGGDITSSNAFLAPAPCTSSAHAIQRAVTVTPTVKAGLSINMEIFLDVKSLGSGLSNSNNFKYALTTSSTSCTEGIITSGNLHGASTGSKYRLLNKNFSASTPETYYLYVWLDEEESSTSTMDQPFALTLSGNCDDQVEPEAPVLDAGMIPVTISANGVVETIHQGDENWYDYDNKEWANVVLVDDDSRTTYKNTSGVTVAQDDILAYYTWIPRYNYRIPKTKCSDIEGVNENDYPGCYMIVLDNEDAEGSIEASLAGWWYDYATANGMPLSEDQAALEVSDGLQNGILNSSLGVQIPMAEFIAVYNQETSSNITYTTELSSTNTISGVTEIDISFEATGSTMLYGDAETTHRSHPAFWWDDNSNGSVDSGEMLPGIWVGKFETSANTDSTCYTANSETNCLSNNVSPRIVPNVMSLRNQNVSNQFATSQKFASSGNAYGLSSTSTNAHMMKNSEWGAVAYLSHSQYGVNQEIYINNSSNYITGRSGGNVGSDSLSATSYGNYTWLGQSVGTDGTIGSYAGDRTLGTNASTTGNVTGVYDMSGGAWEYVMGVLADSSGNPRSGESTDYNSGFNGLLSDNISYTSGVDFPAIKYFDLYETSNSQTACNGGPCYGHALGETANWYGDYANFVNSGLPWFMRGGFCSDGADAGVFYSNLDGGYAFGYHSWRSVLAPGVGA